MIHTTKRALRRFLLETQLLLQPRINAEAGKEQVLDVIRLLECLQIDPVAAVRANQHLVMSARMASYEPSMLNDLLSDHRVFEYFANAACIIPMEHYPIFEPTRLRIREHVSSALEALQPVPEQVMDKLRDEGPLPARAFESEARVHGYWENTNAKAKTKATSHAINLLTDAAHIRIVGREGNQRLFDLTSRSVPAELLETAGELDREEAERLMLLKYFRAYRVFEPSDSRFGWLRLSAAQRRDAIQQFIQCGIVTEVKVEGLKHSYYVLASDAERVLAHHHAADEWQDSRIEAEPDEITFLPPLDNLLWSRKRLEDLFDFEYRWEIYTPADKRKYGYYAMPILAGDRLIGRMDPRLDRKENVLKVELLQFEPEMKVSAQLRKNVKKAVKSFAKANGAVNVIYS
ncbi:winged helix DNA-binding domain-containing protein [Paenibacillus glycanilyticus]|uniref:winged helix-turn-helix domain-containing protein n=1 Tax=Paenibacillus glycanilyticus TaxID=126569 RepID=UPI002040E1B6|nr:crosslink repair DNA glycosylase YcaQ family protein [Paenibacillus glycanilyticus]MCM3628328.1 winged helix DNA-binding domain-containing protein [Paenibacillus glycanilyticus]